MNPKKQLAKTLARHWIQYDKVGLQILLHAVNYTEEGTSHIEDDLVRYFVNDVDDNKLIEYCTVFLSTFKLEEKERKDFINEVHWFIDFDIVPKDFEKYLGKDYTITVNRESGFIAMQHDKLPFQIDIVNEKHIWTSFVAAMPDILTALGETTDTHMRANYWEIYCLFNLYEHRQKYSWGLINDIIQ